MQLLSSVILKLYSYISPSMCNWDLHNHILKLYLISKY